MISGVVDVDDVDEEADGTVELGGVDTSGLEGSEGAAWSMFILSGLLRNPAYRVCQKDHGMLRC